jgi:hypothetical protein
MIPLWCVFDTNKFILCGTKSGIAFLQEEIRWAKSSELAEKASG